MRIKPETGLGSLAEAIENKHKLSLTFFFNPIVVATSLLFFFSVIYVQSVYFEGKREPNIYSRPFFNEYCAFEILLMLQCSTL